MKLIISILENHLKILNLKLQEYQDNKYLRKNYIFYGERLELIASLYATDCEELLLASISVAKFIDKYRSVELLEKKLEVNK